MVVRQNSDKVIVLEDTVTFPSAMIFGIALALIAILMFVSFPLFSEPPFSYWCSTLFIF
ncbi:MAG: hypothetical protein NT051_04240 [Candidatus Micrarchaeota archaeon]|nr:hypothetical protein [Candidatus Micrarchaeota archaeon]